MEKNLNVRQGQESSYAPDSFKDMFQAVLQPVPGAGITEDNHIPYAVSNIQNDKKLSETADRLPGGCWQQTLWSHLGTWRGDTSPTALPVPPNSAFPSHHSGCPQPPLQITKTYPHTTAGNSRAPLELSLSVITEQSLCTVQS